MRCSTGSASSGGSQELRLFLPVPVCRTVLHMPGQGVRELSLSPDGRTLATVCSDTTTFLGM